jgi:hypothetical protein
MMLSNILFLTVSSRKENRGKLPWLFTLYTICALAEDILSMPFKFHPAFITEEIIDFYILVFIGIEFATFYSFFYRIFRDNNAIRNKIRLICWLYTALSLLIITFCCSFFTSQLVIREISGYYSVISSLLLIAPCLYYYYTLFEEEPFDKNLTREPAFWITTGITFLSCINIPLFLVEKYLDGNTHKSWNSIYVINYVGYCVLFLFLTIAFFCKRFHKVINIFNR